MEHNEAVHPLAKALAFGPVEAAKMTQEASDGLMIELLHGKGAHVDPIACVADITAELAGRRDPAYPHSISQILWHLNYWMDYELNRIRGGEPVYPIHAASSWPADSSVSEEEWTEAVGLFSALIDEFAALAKSAEEALRGQVNPTHRVHTQQSSSLRAVVWQIIVHNSYHIGQIAMLRRAHGSWPPPGGGDTW